MLTHLARWHSTRANIRTSWLVRGVYRGWLAGCRNPPPLGSYYSSLLASRGAFHLLQAITCTSGSCSEQAVLCTYPLLHADSLYTLHTPWIYVATHCKYFRTHCQQNRPDFYHPKMYLFTFVLPMTITAHSSWNGILIEEEKVILYHDFPGIIIKLMSYCLPREFALIETNHTALLSCWSLLAHMLMIFVLYITQICKEVWMVQRTTYIIPNGPASKTRSLFTANILDILLPQGNEPKPSLAPLLAELAYVCILLFSS